MVQTILLSVFIVVWGAATIIILVKKGEVPPEYWTLPAIGIGGILAALDIIDRRRNRRDPQEDNESTEESSP